MNNLFDLSDENATVVLVEILSVYLLVFCTAIVIYVRAYRRKQANCKHEKFVFHDKQLMEHEPFCAKCKKSLTEINF